MANPTTNYGFVLPTATDLVTDLPADFDVALQGVDTRLKALQPGTTLGDLAYSSATANTNVRLGIGTNGQVLAVSGGVPAWTTTADVTPLTTKGDLFTFTTVDARLGVGANNTVLTADSAEATGMKWAASSSALTLIQRSSFSNVAGTSTTFDGVFTSTYKTYLVVVEVITAVTAANDLQLQFIVSGTTKTASYYGSNITTDYSTATVTNATMDNATQITLSPGIGASGGGETNGYLYFQRVGNASQKGFCSGSFVGGDALGLNVIGAGNNAADTYTGFLLKSSSTNVTGTVAVYGLATA